MTRWLLRVIALAVLIAAGLWLWSVFFPNPERVIRKRFDAIARTASFSGRESGFAQFDNATRLAAFCTPDVQITVDVPGNSRRSLSGRDELLQTLMFVRSNLGGLSVEFLDLNIQIDNGKTSAVVNLTAKGRVSGERDLVVQELKFVLNKIKGDWLVSEVETVKTLL
jgi:hypothetical protein